MEKDEASSNDFTDYYGSIKHMKDMFSILEKTNDLIEEIKQSDIYKEYEAARSELESHPELKEKTDAFRKDHFEALNAIKTPVCFSEVANMEARYEEVSAYPVIDRYLNAELAVLRLIQRIQNSLMGAIEF